MATPTLDEIEAASDRIATRKSEWASEMLPEITAELLRGLVAHVRALENVTRMTDDRALERITALEAKVAAREQEMDRLRVVLPQRDDMAFEQCARLFEKAAALEARSARMEAKVAALSAADDVGRAAARAESATSPRMAQKAWAPVAEEMDRLRAENAELRKRVEAGEWPAPQPIETAPLGRIMVWVDSLALGDQGYWSYVVSTKSDTLETWRAALRDWGHRLWTPEPPPPGGAK